MILPPTQAEIEERSKDRPRCVVECAVSDEFYIRADAIRISPIPLRECARRIVTEMESERCVSSEE